MKEFSVERFILTAKPAEDFATLHAVELLNEKVTEGEGLVWIRNQQ